MPHARPVPLGQIRLQDPFWERYQALVRERVIPYQWEALNDRVPGAEKSHAIENFRIAAGLAEGSFHGYVFQDSDLYKWLEAVAYRLATHPDPALEADADGAIELIARAQAPDGYLDTYYLVADPANRWTDERRRHELYCAGHLLEAAVAYAEATGKRRLLEVGLRLVDHIAAVFGPEPHQKHGYPGHEGLELALVKLFRLTGDRRHLALAQYFVDERGKRPHFYDIEGAARGAKDFEDYYGDYVYEYTQAHRPVREQKDAAGHAVRAVYLFSGMADVAQETGDEGLAEACRTLWRSITRRRMYVTGAIGSQEYGEDFTLDYDLPNDTMYAETCASIGLAFFAHRMLQLEPRGEYGDVLELALYNGVLSGISLDGTRFFYVNPLQVWPEANRIRRDLRHALPERQPWFGCACCPPNLARLVTSLGQYAYACDGTTAWVHLYAGSEAALELHGQPVRLRQETTYPEGETITLTLGLEAPLAFTLALRIPAWCRTPALSLNGEALEAPMKDGYAYLQRTWQPTDRLDLRLPMPVERVRGHVELRADAGQVALKRGPVVYCLEEADHGPNLAALALDRHAPLEVHHEPELLGGTLVVTGTARRRVDEGEALYTTAEPLEQDAPLRAVPYRAWGNRDPGEMRVWIREA